MAKFDELPTRDLAAEDYVLIQSEGGPTSRTQFSAKSIDDLGLVTKEDVATDSNPGIVKPDGTTLLVDGEGAISVNIEELPEIIRNDEGSALINMADLIMEVVDANADFLVKNTFVDDLLGNNNFINKLVNNQSFIDALVAKLPIVSTTSAGLAPQIPEA